MRAFLALRQPQSYSHKNVHDVINEIKMSVNILSFFYLFIHLFLLLLLLFSIVHFTVTDAKEAEVDLVLIQPLSFFIM